MDSRTTWLVALLLAAAVTMQGCGPAATGVSSPTPPETERPDPTATAEPTVVMATDEPTTEPTEPPSPTKAPPSPTAAEATPTATRQPEEATATTEEPTATSEPTSAPDDQEGRVLLEERCTVCHNLDRVERTQKSRESWVDTVDRMIGYGAQLSDSERTVLLDYLVDTYGQ